MDSYNLEPTNCCIPIFTYKFTYLRIAMLYLRIHLLIPTNCCIPIRTTFYLQISFTYKKLHINSYNIVPMNSSTIMNYQHVTSNICHLVDENNQWSSTILIPQGDGFLDIYLALMGDLSATPVGATKQLTVFPTGKSASFYCFNPDLYQGEELWPTLKEMLINAARVSGCSLSTKYSSL
jgi:hypothetical protein